jgi:dihydroorotate dehydrogenase electron transfer subunit
MEHEQLNVKVVKTKEEAKNIKTLFFDRNFGASPGQYAMVWIRGIDEIPMSFSYTNAITVKKVGDATSALFRFKKGDSLGLRGPFGRPFEIKGKKVALVAGGIGAAPLAFLAEKCRGKIKTFLGARCKEELLFVGRFKNVGEVEIATDDGSAGRRGFVSELLSDNLKNFDQIYTCGPEAMMYRVLNICAKLRIEKRLQLCTERYLKCGLGLCGSCDLGGLRVCVDGPVFRGDELLRTEFGKYRRSGSGKRISV